MPALSTIRKFFPKVNKVTDGDEGFNIEVTAQDEKQSRKRDHAGCALAVACKRKLHLDGALVSRSVAYLIKGDNAIRFTVPPSVSREVTSYDRGAGFEPGTYSLTRPCKSVRLGKHSGGKDTHRAPHSITAHSRFRHITKNMRAQLRGRVEE